MTASAFLVTYLAKLRQPDLWTAMTSRALVLKVLDANEAPFMSEWRTVRQVPSSLYWA